MIESILLIVESSTSVSLLLVSHMDQYRSTCFRTSEADSPKRTIHNQPHSINLHERSPDHTNNPKKKLPDLTIYNDNDDDENDDEDDFQVMSRSDVYSYNKEDTPHNDGEN